MSSRQLILWVVALGLCAGCNRHCQVQRAERIGDRDGDRRMTPRRYLFGDCPADKQGPALDAYEAGYSAALRAACSEDAARQIGARQADRLAAPAIATLHNCPPSMKDAAIAALRAGFSGQMARNCTYERGRAAGVAAGKRLGNETTTHFDICPPQVRGDALQGYADGYLAGARGPCSRKSGYNAGLQTGRQMRPMAAAQARFRRCPAPLRAELQQGILTGYRAGVRPRCNVETGRKLGFGRGKALQPKNLSAFDVCPPDMRAQAVSGYRQGWTNGVRNACSFEAGFAQGKHDGAEVRPQSVEPFVACPNQLRPTAINGYRQGYKDGLAAFCATGNAYAMGRAAGAARNANGSEQLRVCPQRLRAAAQRAFWRGHRETYGGVCTIKQATALGMRRAARKLPINPPPPVLSACPPGARGAALAAYRNGYAEFGRVGVCRADVATDIGFSDGRAGMRKNTKRFMSCAQIARREAVTAYNRGYARGVTSQPRVIACRTGAFGKVYQGVGRTAAKARKRAARACARAGKAFFCDKFACTAPWSVPGAPTPVFSCTSQAFMSRYTAMGTSRKSAAAAAMNQCARQNARMHCSIMSCASRPIR